jgi:16S rRNA (guanine527-N7)-methyltransferase
VPREAFLLRLKQRCEKSGVVLPLEAVNPLDTYFDLLVKWNTRINLTSLPLNPLADEAVDRLFVEPLAALPYVPPESISWFDLGSGGGSPAIPLRVASGHGALTMVEAKARKAAFLRDVVRLLNLPNCSVENARLEAVAQAHRGSAHLVTVRAVRADAALTDAVASLLGFEGRLLLFTSSSAPYKIVEFEHLETVRLIKSRNSFLSVYRRVVSRGTQLSRTHHR